MSIISSSQKTKVKIIDILSPPVAVGIITSPNIEKFSDIAKKDPELLPVIALAKTNDGKLYALNHHDVILGCKKAGPGVITEIHVEIIPENCMGSDDILIKHVREITSNELFNPISIYETIDFLEEKMQKNRKDILELLHLNGTIYEKLILSGINNHISEESVQRLQKITASLSARNLLPSMIVVPPYVLSKISRLESVKEQLLILDEIQYDLEHMSDSRFAWHTPEQIDHMIKSNRQEASHEENKREESTVATPTKTKDVGKNEKKSKSTKEEKQNQTKTHQPVNKETETIKKSIPNMIIIPDQKTGKPQMLVNKRTCTVSQIEKSDNHSIIKTTSVGTKSLYSIPFDVTRHLEFDDDEYDNTIRHKNFENVRDLQKFLKMFPTSNGQSKLTLFWSSA
ncbi:hypothetical protein [Nitrosopumilus sp.]|uniref:hypothetical protein n=1 Tax=Nitrosopumilus sp. TaxID=2024843 RepID=UPI00292E5E0D|nr:hypothetical protein [Nitrosopumilus sp.]